MHHSGTNQTTIQPSNQPTIQPTNPPTQVGMRHSDLSGTAYLDFENVRVPNFNLVGRENDGFKMVMFNFNHERWMVACACSRFSRVCLEESVKYALRRRTFGKLLHEHQSVRMKVKVKVGGGWARGMGR